MQIFQDGGAPIKAWIDGVPLEDEARAQLINTSRLPFVYKHLAVMPDVHWGAGSTVGSVIATRGAIVPAAVGVDIGCGMMAVRLNLSASDLPDNLHALRTAIEAAVPHGRTDNGGPNDRGAWGTPSLGAACSFDELKDDLMVIVRDDVKLNRAARKAHQHMGTLGTGNHFIEVCLDEEQRVWVMLHSGSRGIGNAIGQHFIARAKEDMKRWFITVPDVDLAYLIEGSENFNDYWAAVQWAQYFALLNRRVMMNTTIEAIKQTLGVIIERDLEAINCHHNYVTRERHFGDNVMVTRKGAVSARDGQLGIIPGSMGTGSFIVRGKGNRDSFNSCSHGAGRAMSRTQARKQFTIADHIKATEGVECRVDAEVLDETPGAYKDIGKVMEAQHDLVDIVHSLKQVLCVKG